MHEACVLREAETLIWCLAQDFVQATELIKAKIQNKHPIISLSPTIQYTVENRTNYLLCPVFHAMIMMINNSSADDNAVFLPEWFNPTDRDVICGWARQNHRHGKKFSELSSFVLHVKDDPSALSHVLSHSIFSWKPKV